VSEVETDAERGKNRFAQAHLDLPATEGIVEILKVLVLDARDGAPARGKLPGNIAGHIKTPEHFVGVTAARQSSALNTTDAYRFVPGSASVQPSAGHSAR